MTKVQITKLFELERGNGNYTKTYCNSHKRPYPVYSGNTVSEFSLIDSYDYDGKYLSWSIDGLDGYMMFLECKFSATNHRGILIAKEDNINLTYIKFVLEPIFREKSKGRKGVNGVNEYTALPPKIIKDIMVPIPTKYDSSYDLEKQQEISKKYIQIEEIRKFIYNKINEVISINPIITYLF